jgi:hypothetical protein
MFHLSIVGTEMKDYCRLLVELVVSDQMDRCRHDEEET